MAMTTFAAVRRQDDTTPTQGRRNDPHPAYAGRVGRAGNVDLRALAGGRTQSHASGVFRSVRARLGLPRDGRHPLDAQARLRNVETPAAPHEGKNLRGQENVYEALLLKQAVERYARQCCQMADVLGIEAAGPRGN